MARKPKVDSENTVKAPMKKSAEMPVNLPLAEDAEFTNFGAEYRSRCGGALRATREKLGFTTQEIASRLRLSNKQIEAIEADNFAVLPEATIVKGFIRNYAKQLKIDAEPLLDAYNVIVPSKAPQSFSLKPTIDMKVTAYKKPNAMRYALFGLAAALGFGVWLFYENYVQKPSPVNPAAEIVKPQVGETLPEAALPAAERNMDETITQLTLPNNGATTSEVTTASEVATIGAETAVVTPPPANPALPATTIPTQTVPASSSPPTPQPPAAQPAPTQAETSQFETSIGMSKLELNATQETWVSVTDATGKEIYNKTLFAGNREVIEAKRPLNITVGNALGATLVVNGKPVDLAPHTRTNVAHVKID